MLRKILEKLFIPFVLFIASAISYIAVEDVPFLTYQQLVCQVKATCPREVDISSGLLFYASLTLYLFAGIFIVLKIISDVNREEKRNTSLRNRIWETELRAFSTNLNITPKDRITLYIQIPSTRTFFKAGRVSPNTSYMHGGRTTYTSGLIDKAFNSIEETITISNDPNSNLKAYLEEVFCKSQIEKSVIKRFSMRSRYLYARKVQKLNGSAIGVLLFETTESSLNHLKDEDGNTITEEKIKKIFKRECQRLSHFLEDFELPAQLFQMEEGAVK